MLTKHFLAKAYMNRQNESLLTDVIGVPIQLGYAVFWDFWHKSSTISSLDCGKIQVQNFFYYRKWKMNAEDCKKANEITLAIYEALLKSNFYTVTGKEKQYYSYTFDHYFEYADLPHVIVRVYSDKRLKNQQELYIQFDANQVKAIESDQYLKILNQCLASIDDNLTVLEPTTDCGWYCYKIKDDSVNYRLDLANFQLNSNDFTVRLDGGHNWNLLKQYGAIISGSTGTGKTGLLYGLIYQLLHKQNVLLYVADGKNDELGAVMSQILPADRVVVGIDTAQLVHKLVKLSDKRYKDMSKKRKKNSQLAFANFNEFGFKMIVVIIDEQSAITASLTDSKLRRQYQNDLMKLVQTSRVSGIIPILSMQQANAATLGGTLGTAIREQLVGLKVLLGTDNTITSQDRQMIFGTGVELPTSHFSDVGSGYLQTADMPAPESFQAPLLPKSSEKLYKLLSQK